jgi:quinol monooxygenase YgiN
MVKIVTIVTGKIPGTKIGEFKEGFAEFKEGSMPEGLIQSCLLNDDENPDIYIIFGVWEKPESFLEVRSVESPRGLKIFQNIGIEPKTKIYKVLDTLHR